MLDYGINDVRTLDGMEAIRLRPGMYIGSVEREGVHHIVLEAISNSVDEYLADACSKINVTIDIDKTITIEDNGRGIPFDNSEEGKQKFINIFTKPHTGAKFDSSGKKGYNSSGGLNGTGIKATNALSKYFKAISKRNGLQATIEFNQGKQKKLKIEQINSKEHGTFIQFRPDPEIFKTTTEVDYNWIRKILVELSYLSPGLIFNFKYQDKIKEAISSKNGIKDYMNDLFENKVAITSMFYTKNIEEQIGIEVALRYGDTYSDSYKLFTNSIPNSGGTHLTGFRTALTQSINEYAREKGLLKDKDNNLTGDELKEGLVLILSFKMPDPVFSGQTKDVLSSAEARTAVQRLASKELKLWFETNPKDAKAIVEKALLARAAREKAKKAKDAVRNIEGKKKKQSFMNLPTKLVDCWSKHRNECELVICEGDSAATGLTEARDAEYQAIFPIRGKIISARKCTSEKLLANQEVVNIIKALGLEFDAKTAKLVYNPKKLRYHSIMIAADANFKRLAV